MKDRSPFGIAALWENWQDPATREWVRTFVVLTTPSNDLVSRIHDRMPAILNPAGYERWLGLEPDPHDLLVPFPSEPMTIWPISRRVNSPDNDDERLLEENSRPPISRSDGRCPISRAPGDAQTPGVSGMNISPSPSDWTPGGPSGSNLLFLLDENVSEMGLGVAARPYVIA